MAEFDHLRRPTAFRVAFHCDKHPLWIKLLSSKTNGERERVNWTKARNALIYSLDSADRYFGNVKARAAQKARRNARDQRVKEFTKTLMGSKKLHYEHIQTVAAVSHLQNNFRSGCVYSLPAGLNVFQGLNEALVNCQPPVGAPVKRRRQHNVDSVLEQPNDDAEERFFKLLIHARRRAIMFMGCQQRRHGCVQGTSPLQFATPNTSVQTCGTLTWKLGAIQLQSSRAFVWPVSPQTCCPTLSLVSMSIT